MEQNQKGQNNAQNQVVRHVFEAQPPVQILNNGSIPKDAIETLRWDLRLRILKMFGITTVLDKNGKRIRSKITVPMELFDYALRITLPKAMPNDTPLSYYEREKNIIRSRYAMFFGSAADNIVAVK